MNIAYYPGCTMKTKAANLEIAAVEAALSPDDVHFPEPALICLENTHNRHGGRVKPIIFTFVWAPQMGASLGASADGRRASMRSLSGS